MSAFNNNNSKKKTNNNRIYIFVNISIYLFVAAFIYFEVKLAFTETNTGIKYKVVNKGKGMSISEYIEKVNTENVDKKDEKGNFISKKVNDVRFLLSFERNITYKNKIVEYKNENPGRPYIYDYEYLMNNNYCGDYIECANMLKNIGDTYLFKIKKKYLKNDESVQNLNISDEEYLCVELKLVDIMDTRNRYGLFMSHINRVYTTYNNKKALEKEYIMRYLNNIGRKYYSVGDYFVTIDDPGRGDYIKEGDRVKFNMTICRHKCKPFETTYEETAKINDIYDNKKEYKPLEIVYKKCEDYTNALCKFKKGSVGKIYYPTVTFDKNKGINFYEVYIDIITVIPAPKKEEIKKVENKKIENKDKVKKENTTVNNSESNKNLNNNNNINSNNIPETNKKDVNKVEKDNKKNKKEKNKSKKSKKEEVKHISLGKKNKKIKNNKEKELSTKEVVEKAKEKRKEKTKKIREDIGSIRYVYI